MAKIQLTDKGKGMLEQLRGWLKEKNLSNASTYAFSRKYNIPATTYKAYIREEADMSRSSPRNLQKMYEATGLECFNPANYKPSKIGNRRFPVPPRAANSPGKNTDQKINEINERLKGLEKLFSGKDRIEKTSNLFYQFADSLEYFKNASPEERKKLTEKISEEDVGYITSFLTSAYHEDKFKAWIFRSQYMRKGAKK
jgi:hypothetical protein